FRDDAFFSAGRSVKHIPLLAYGIRKIKPTPAVHDDVIRRSYGFARTMPINGVIDEIAVGIVASQLPVFAIAYQPLTGCIPSLTIRPPPLYTARCAFFFVPTPNGFTR